MIERFTRENYQALCAQVAKRDTELKGILKQYGPPPFWVRPNRLETLVLTILEQQVSLASAYAAYKRLKERVGNIAPEAILALSDEDLRGCYFSRQKIGYVRGLAMALSEGRISLKRYHYLPDEEVRGGLKQLKGIGDWTVDIYLLHALRRTDIFPLGDLALVNSIREVKGLAPAVTKEEVLALAEPWRPYRSMATLLLWHSYIQRRGIRLEH
ncbi:MAG TPA: DNA-3-methyladenine glycosylase 2 family protein [Chitinophagaceae bacterium]